MIPSINYQEIVGSTDELSGQSVNHSNKSYFLFYILVIMVLFYLSKQSDLSIPICEEVKVNTKKCM